MIRIVDQTPSEVDHAISRLGQEYRYRAGVARARQCAHRRGDGEVFRRRISGHVTIGKEGFGFRTDCVVHLDSGIVLEADALAADAYASADQAALRLEKRLRRYKHRLKDHQMARAGGRPHDDRAPDRAPTSAPNYVIAAPEHDSEEEATQWNPVVIAESTAALKRLSVSEAVVELDMSGTPVMVFRHAGHGRINLVYRRADGHIGWIDLPSIEQDAH